MANDMSQSTALQSVTNRRDHSLAETAGASRETARVSRACLDLTSLNDVESARSTQELVRRVGLHEPQVAAVCVWPQWAAVARRHAPAGLRVAAVANFPLGATDTAAALQDAQRIADAGADEIDLVLPWRALLAGDTASCAHLVRAVRRAAPQLTLKLIIESGELADQAHIELACRLGIAEGVDFLKTSTGKAPRGASPEAARWMLQAIAADSSAAQRVGFKVSGGVRTLADAALYIQLVRENLGDGAIQASRFRIGASSLLDSIDAVLGGEAGAEPCLPHRRPQPPDLTIATDAACLRDAR